MYSRFRLYNSRYFRNFSGLVVRLRNPPSDKQENIPPTIGLGYGTKPLLVTVLNGISSTQNFLVQLNTNNASVLDKYELDHKSIVLGETLGRGQFGVRF